MNEEIISQYSVIACTGFKIETIDGEDLTEDLKKITHILSDKEGI